MPTNTKLLVAILVAVAVIGGVLIGMWAGGVFDKEPERDSSCFWSEQLGFQHTNPSMCR